MIRHTVLRVLVGLAVAAGLIVASPSAGQAAACRVTFHGKVGYQLCGTTDEGIIYFSNGTQRRFVIGTNSQVYNIVYYPSTGYVSNWQSLGGTATRYVRLDRLVGVHPDYFAIITVGSDGRNWCKAYQKGWTSWYRCH